ncbi:MurR/RpiR family transcriptional regulator [Wukongibacter baidiensis]|uniref:MurR/RpiR family transcriptional regulator n=1 Tax=Wukongibacter baidiensis TaxID=1723361 RepID=UPI003D7FD4ED
MIRQMLDTLPPSEKKIATYILNNPHNIIDITTHELAKRSDASSAAVVRLSKSLGLKGFGDLKMRILGDLNNSVETTYRDIEAGEDTRTMISKVTVNSLKAIQETSKIIDIDELNKAVRAIKDSKRILLFGIGASSLVCVDGEQKFTRINKNAYFTNDVHKMSACVANLEEKDVFIGVSYSGDTHEVINIMELAKMKGATTIGITKYGKSMLAERSDIKLFVSNVEKSKIRSSATASRIAQLHVIDLLFMCYATTFYDETIEYIDETRNFVNMYKEKR